MAKYHINAKGEPGVCRATKGNCPLGGDTDHYSSPEAARSAYEKNQAPLFTEPATAKKNPISLETESTMETVPSEKIKKGDIYRGEEVQSVSVGRKWVTLSTDKSREILVAKDESTTVIREQLTQEAQAVQRDQWEDEWTERNVKQRLEQFDKARDDFNTSIEKHGNFDSFSLETLIKAQAKADISKQITRKVDKEGIGYKQATQDLQTQYKERIANYEINSGLSRSTSLTSNLLEDAKTEATLNFIRDGMNW
jgi:hypothetical protein